MLAIALIQLDFDVYLPHPPTPVPVFDGADSRGVTATMVKGVRQPDVRVLTESADRFRAKPVEAYNHLEVVFRKPEFERLATSTRDPSTAMVEHAANDFLTRLAYFSRAASIEPLRLEHCAWKLDYLNDDRSELLPEDGKYRGHETMSTHTGPMISGGADFWTEFAKLPPGFSIPAWHPLLAQADRAMPDVGNALLLAAIALEVFVEIAISEHARNSSVPRALWDWISSRNGGRGPSTPDQYSVLLDAVCSHNLKESPRLWKALRNTLDARNSFAHTGKTLISGKLVTEAQARELIGLAREIIGTVNAWLSADSQSAA